MIFQKDYANEVGYAHVDERRSVPRIFHKLDRLLVMVYDHSFIVRLTRRTALRQLESKLRVFL